MASIGKRGDKWHVRICRKDHPTICKSFSLLRDAQTWAKNTELRLERGEALGRETVLLSALLQRYLTSVSPLKKGHKQEVSRLNAWLKHPLANRDAASIKPAEIALYRDQRIKAGKANASIRIELSLLSAVYKCAKHEWGFTLLTNPLADIKRPPPSRGRERRLEEGEIDALLAATKGTTLSSLILLAVETAMRAGEILSLRWENINFDKRTALLPDTKNGERRIVPLSSKALQILSTVERAGDTVFPISSSYTISNAFKRATQRAGIIGLRFHDLRHEVAFPHRHGHFR
jgi:integrase